MRNVYTTNAYSCENAINTKEMTFPGEFDTFAYYWVNYNLNDTCANYYHDSSGILNDDFHLDTYDLLECKSIGNGILQKGLKQSVVYVIEQERDLVSNFFQEPTIDAQTSLDYLNSDRFQQGG